MNEMEQKTVKDLTITPTSEAQGRDGQGAQTFVAEHSAESPMFSSELMEEIVSDGNVVLALKKVEKNGGSPGIDGMKADKLRLYLRHQWRGLREQLVAGTYRPQPVKRVEIPKPGGGVRKLGIPTALDRFIQQAILQVLQARWDATFADQSYGFRPGRSQHMAVARAQSIISAGYEYVVDIDLEKFFDRVNHDRLMSRLAKEIPDKRLLKLLRAYLNAGVLEEGLVKPTVEGTPQGGPLSPFLSNVVLDELDRELNRRGHRFVRYADDCNIYVKTQRAGERVMKGVTEFIEKRLKLKVNVEKSAVAKPQKRKFLGFSFKFQKVLKRVIAPQSLTKFETTVRAITRRSRGRSVEQVASELSLYLKGWGGYFRFCQTRSTFERLDSWVRRRLRCLIWHQWKTPSRRASQLRKLGLPGRVAEPIASTGLGPWPISQSRPLHAALSNQYFDKQLKIPRLTSMMNI